MDLLNAKQGGEPHISNGFDQVGSSWDALYTPLLCISQITSKRKVNLDPYGGEGFELQEPEVNLMNCDPESWSGGQYRLVSDAGESGPQEAEKAGRTVRALQRLEQVRGHLEPREMEKPFEIQIEEQRRMEAGEAPQWP